jgi:hypothetical protein
MIPARRIARIAALLWLALATLPAAQAEAPVTESFETCRGHVQGQWQVLGRGGLDACLKALDQVVDQYDVQGFKFGLHGNLMLASDLHYFYQSIDGGQRWSVLGAKSEMKQRLAAAPLLGKPAQSGNAELRRTGTPTVEQRSCSLFIDGAWQSGGAIPLQACIARLDATPDAYDSVGYKYAYWGALFLAADKDQLLRSDNGQDWKPVGARGTVR